MTKRTGTFIFAFSARSANTYQTIILVWVCCRWLFFFFFFHIHKNPPYFFISIKVNAYFQSTYPTPFSQNFLLDLSSLAIDLWRTNGAKAKWWRLVGYLSIRNRRDTERELSFEGNGRGGGGESMSSPSYILSPSSSYTLICVHHYRLNSHKVSFVCVCWGGIDLLCYTRIIYSSTTACIMDIEMYTYFGMAFCTGHMIILYYKPVTISFCGTRVSSTLHSTPLSALHPNMI